MIGTRAATSAGDQIEAENLYQHAEHYCRMLRQGVDGHPVSGDGLELHHFSLMR
ncbi:DUF4167 domain-containing protein [Leptospira interrogans]